MSTNNKQLGRERRHRRIRSTVVGTAARPRLSIYKSNRYMHAQLIDDSVKKTLLAGSTKVAAAKGARAAKTMTKTEAAKKLGVELAKAAQAAGITTVVFDRGGFRYTGRVVILAEAAREGGLTF